MRNKRKVMGVVATVVFLLVILGLFSIPFRQNADLLSLEKEVNNIFFPINIEKIAIKSAIGDSGGNGDYSTLRVVVVVKTNLDKVALEDTLKKMNLRFPKHYNTINNVPIFYVTRCYGAEFRSSRQFILDFDELKSVSNYSDYYFIEFVE